VEVLSAKSEEALKPIEDSESSSWSSTWSIYHIDWCIRETKFLRGKKRFTSSIDYQIPVPLWKTSHGI